MSFIEHLREPHFFNQINLSKEYILYVMSKWVMMKGVIAPKAVREQL